MAYTYIKTNDGLPNTKRLRAAMNDLMAWRRTAFGVNHPLFAVKATMLAMRDGDGSQASHYALVTTSFGCETDAKAKKLFEEIEAVCFYLGSGSATQDQITAAVDQLEGLTQA